MKINSLNNAMLKPSFGAVIGKLEISEYYGSGINTVTKTFHVYPFKDEFISKEERVKKEKQIIDGAFPDIEPLYGGMIKRAKVVFENPLPFTQQEFEQALKYPGNPGVSKEALDFIRSDDYCATVTRHDSCYMPRLNKII